MVLLKARSKEWFELRKKVITGTDISALFALNPNSSVPKVIRNKLNLKEDTLEDNSIIRTGRMMENVCIASVHEMGYDVKKAAEEGFVNFVTHKNQNLGSSLDALLDNYPAECKSTESKEKFAKWLKGELSIHYILQIYVQLMCLNKDHGFVIGCLSLPPFPTILFKIKTNKEIDQIVISTVNRFWDELKKQEKFKINQDDKKKLLTLLPKSCSIIDISWIQKDDEISLEELF